MFYLTLIGIQKIRVWWDFSRSAIGTVPSKREDLQISSPNCVVPRVISSVCNDGHPLPTLAGAVPTNQI